MGAVRQPNELERVLMERDKMTLSEVRQLISDAQDHLEDYNDPEDFMEDWFGLELDYFIFVV